MTRTIALSVMLATCAAALVAPAVAKLPPGSSFEVCGAAGCRTTTPEAVPELEIKVIEPTMEVGTLDAPSVASEWTVVDLTWGSADEDVDVTRRFPVVFAPEAGYIAVSASQGQLAWVRLRSSQARAYTQLTRGTEPLSSLQLAELDDETVADAQTGAEPPTVTESPSDNGMPGWLIATVAALVVTAVAVVSARRYSS
jgi:hypothetical protein